MSCHSVLFARNVLSRTCRRMYSVVEGAGFDASKLGGAGGSIRQAGGAFGKLEQAREEEYFYKLQKRQLEQLKKLNVKAIEHHRQEAELHLEAIERNKRRLQEIEAELQKTAGQK
ncbi:mitochondrial ATPase inhibitor, IATP domain-containing protein [Ditylenchus destructor]|uniref:ATPase inhibitor, mitochondrial n=1 Tax=Ditylenchus destructor TaxID=166010 RepID=A0AAD4QYT7_9BILA|nr:mitochondrial ATPase inhibitor, IATP domain-containing protein [Ditylenchus destructor]